MDNLYKDEIGKDRIEFELRIVSYITRIDDIVKQMIESNNKIDARLDEYLLGNKSYVYALFVVSFLLILSLAVNVFDIVTKLGIYTWTN